MLAPAPKADVEQWLPPGTRRTYWRGAHSTRLDEVVGSAICTVAASRARRAR